MTHDEVARLWRLVADGTLVHPTKGLSNGHSNFADLANALSMCCGMRPERVAREPEAAAIATELGGERKRHLVFVLCDGMGTKTLEVSLPENSFLRTHNQPDRLVAVFPSTTPAALTTLATGAWPGQHGVPGWDLRDQAGCEFPGEAGHGPVQLRVLHARLSDMRTNEPLGERGFSSSEVFVKAPWANPSASSRAMLFVNAYNKTEFPVWYRNGKPPATEEECAADIEETAAETLGQPEGSATAVEQFAKACAIVRDHVHAAERDGRSSYSYIYTAHPDKHMHALGAEHDEVKRVVVGLDAELRELWENGLAQYDATLVISADHGHMTVRPENMVVLQEELLDCLEYANIGVHGKGRHALFHCRSGRGAEFQTLWQSDERLTRSFLLLTIEQAGELGLFGPDPPLPKVRPRLGDFLAVAVGADTLVTPTELNRHCHHCQGAHGSLARDEMRIPLVVLTSQGGA